MRVLYMCISLSTVMLFSPASADVLVSLPDTSACGENLLCLPINVGNVTGQNVIAFACSVNFDQTIVNAVAPYINTSSGLVSNWTILDTVNNASGWLKIGGFAATPLTGSGQLLSLYFTILPGASGGEVSSLSFVNFEFNEGTPAANTVDGSIMARNPTPGQVTGVTASSDLCDRVYITWTPISHVSGYQIFRNDTLITGADSNATGQSDWTAPDGSHQYKVRALTSCGDGPFSTTISGTRLWIPAAPSPVVASDTSCTSVWVTWQDVAGETSYQINRDSTPIGLSLPANTTSYRDTTAVPGTTYQYIVLAINACGNAADTDSGRRLAPPPQVSGVTTTTNRCDSVIVTWNGISNASEYFVFRNGAQIGIVSSGSTRFADAPAAGAYLYKVRALNSCDWGPYSNEIEGTRLAPPLQINGITATTNRCDSVIINWNEIAAATEYFIFRGGVQIGIIPTGTTRFADAPAAGTYLYRVRAYNSCDWGPYSDEVEGTRLGLPVQVTGVTATSNRCDSVVVTWNVASLAASYEITRNWTVLTTLPGGTIRYADAPPPGTYSYRVRSINSCGSADASLPVEGTRQVVPTQVLGVSASDDLCNGVRIIWTIVPSGVDSFQIRRDGIRVGQAAGSESEFTDTTTVAWTIYTYTVVAFNVCGASPVSVTDNGMCITHPVQVTGVTATTTRCDSIIITWNDVEHEFEYFVYRYDQFVGTVPENTVHIADAPDAGVWGYTVLASNACGNAPISTQAQGERLAAPSQVSGVIASDGLCNGVVVTWNNVSNEDSFQVRRDDARIAAVLSDVLTYTDTLAVSGVVYDYSIVAYNLCGPGQVSNSDSGYRATIPAQVTDVQTTINRCDSVIVTWTDVVTETLYRIYRDGNDVGTSPSNTTHFADQPPTGTYQYAVRAENVCGNGVISAPTTGTRIDAPLPPTITAGPPECMTIVIFPEAGGGEVDSFFFYRDGANRVGSVHASAESWVEMIVGIHDYYATAYSVNCDLESAASNTIAPVGHDLAFPPSTLTVITPETCDSIRLNWPEGTGEIEGYVVRRDGNTIDTVVGLNYSDLNVDDVFDHIYAIAGYNQYCGIGDFTELANGHILPLTQIITDVPATISCHDTIELELNHCLEVESDSCFLSVNFGQWEYLTHFAPVQDIIQIVVPEQPQDTSWDCQMLCVAHRGTRIDSVFTTQFIICCALAVDDPASAEIPIDFALDQNYPNPFNPATTVKFGIPKAAEIQIEILDILGRHVTTLTEGVYQPGWHRIAWDCSSCSTGMYILRMRTGEKILLRKMMLLK
jgi:fibronectin type 3 domain-containing protein